MYYAIASSLPRYQTTLKKLERYTCNPSINIIVFEYVELAGTPTLTTFKRMAKGLQSSYSSIYNAYLCVYFIIVINRVMCFMIDHKTCVKENALL